MAKVTRRQAITEATERNGGPEENREQVEIFHTPCTECSPNEINSKTGNHNS